jgi:hypothetical protein
MELENVTLTKPDETQKKMGAQVGFILHYSDGTVSHAPIDPTNRFYWEVKHWCEQQETPPFNFDFDGYAEKKNGSIDPAEEQ